MDEAQANPGADPAFGTFALPTWRERLRRIGEGLPDTRAGRLACSTLRRVVQHRGAGPYDVEVFPGIHARLYPTTNRCEKRVFVAPQFFDAPERAILAADLARSTSSPYRFVDLGANVGFYSLFMLSQARALGRPLAVLAVEPDPVTRARLQVNCAASGAVGVIAIEASAVGREAGTGAIEGHGVNRGEHRIVTAADPGANTIAIAPLHTLCARHGFDRIDAVKIDIEGHDLQALEGFFEGAPPALWPGLILVEAGKLEERPAVVRLCEAHGYTLEARTRLNAALRRRVQV